WAPLPSPTFSLLTGQWLDFHQLADYHASRTTAPLSFRFLYSFLVRYNYKTILGSVAKFLSLNDN
ncbi:MAG: hypothetical protein WC856_23940, partial [Methylococcaceae bacterium]